MDGQRFAVIIMVVADLMDNRALLQNHTLLLLLLLLPLPPRGHQLLLLHKHRLLLLLLLMLPKGHWLLLRGRHRLPKGHRLPERCWKWLLMVLLRCCAVARRVAADTA